MACPDMDTNVCPTPLSIHRATTMLSRLVTTLANRSRAIGSLRHRLLRKTGEAKQETVAQDFHARVTEPVDDRPPAPTGKQERRSDPEFIRTQSQLMHTTLKALILASGWSVDGSTKRNGSKSKH